MIRALSTRECQAANRRQKEVVALARRISEEEGDELRIAAWSAIPGAAALTSRGTGTPYIECWAGPNLHLRVTQMHGAWWWFPSFRDENDQLVSAGSVTSLDDPQTGRLLTTRVRAERVARALVHVARRAEQAYLCDCANSADWEVELVEWCECHDLPGLLGQHAGYCDPTQRVIRIRTHGRRLWQQNKALAHEIEHVLGHPLFRYPVTVGAGMVIPGVGVCGGSGSALSAAL